MYAAKKCGVSSIITCGGAQAIGNLVYVEKVNKIADSIRQVLGDQLTGIKGKEVRPPGRVN